MALLGLPVGRLLNCVAAHRFLSGAARLGEQNEREICSFKELYTWALIGGISAFYVSCGASITSNSFYNALTDLSLFLLCNRQSFFLAFTSLQCVKNLNLLLLDFYFLLFGN